MSVQAAYKWANGMVMVFDERGEQIPELQGKHTPELEAKIRSRARPSTEFRGFDQPLVWRGRSDDFGTTDGEEA